MAVRPGTSGGAADVRNEGGDYAWTRNGAEGAQSSDGDRASLGEESSRTLLGPPLTMPAGDTGDANNVLMGLGISLLAVVMGLLIWRIVVLSRLVARMRDELAGLVDAAVLRTPDALALIGPGRPTLITIEILNHFELARNENRLAGHAAVVAPELIRKEVTRQAVLRVKEELQRQGVKGEVRVVRGD